jgi:hemoglobin
LKDITDREDLAGLLTDFYGRAFGDDLLGPVVVDIAHMDLPQHLPVMCDFWMTGTPEPRPSSPSSRPRGLPVR